MSRSLWLSCAASLASFLIACDEGAAGAATRPGQRAPASSAAGELTGEFFKRAHSALLERVGSQAELLEMRAQARELSYLVHLEGKIKQIDYVESSPLGLGAASTPVNTASGKPAATSVVTQVGQIFGPDPVEETGEGPLSENLFPLKDVSVMGIVQSFAVAIQAVDPEFGRVTAVTIRRYLPFSTAIRARIYVDSPRMSGSIDTNERGVPLKQW